MVLEPLATVEKIWGRELIMANDKSLCVKLMILKRGWQCSLHYHKIKDEMFLVQSGAIRFEIGDKNTVLKPGDYVRVRPLERHRFAGIEDSTFVEFSTQDFLEDSYRIEPSGPM